MKAARAKIFKVDSFAEKPFAGNPAGVCILTTPRDEKWMQGVAREMNLAETAFLRKRSDGYALRWFTPTVEVELCGHATLASAHVLWETRTAPARETLRFHTKSGVLRAAKMGDLIELDFPATPEKRAAAPEGLLESLGVEPVYIGKNKFDYLVEVGSEAAVRGVVPNYARLATVDARGVIVTARAKSPKIDFVSRFFAPAVGVDEDPVTGSAHCSLGPYWAAKLGRTELTAYQASARGGIVHVRLEGDRVRLGGRAVTILRGELAI